MCVLQKRPGTTCPMTEGTGTSDVTGTKTFLHPRKLRALRVPRRHDQPPALLSSPLLSSL